ncbi:MAG: 4'-phosphopantetheinyl transferase family protein [Solirubrobacteraceae bacterium]
MIEAILPGAVSAVEQRGDGASGSLYPAELSALGDAVARRREEFATGRACAREALAGLGIGPAPVPSAPDGAPCWPPGVVGSITHCEGYRACAVGRREEIAAVGIDAEPDAPLPVGVIGEIALAEELACVARLAGETPGISWDRLLFSAKEALYKAWRPLADRQLGFADATLALTVEGTFSARLLAPGPLLAGGRPTTVPGRWLAGDGLLLTAVVLPVGGWAETA